GPCQCTPRRRTESHTAQTAAVLRAPGANQRAREALPQQPRPDNVAARCWASECGMFSYGASDLRARFARKMPLGVFWMSTGSTAVMELAAEAAPDAIVIDAQHGLWDRQSLEHAVGLVSHRVPVLVRTADASAIAISQSLDTGAEGVIVPLIETDTRAAAAVAAARFPPHGSRSGGGVRPLAHDFARYYAAANDR